MKTKNSAYYQRQFRQRLREQGLIKKEVWILPENTCELLRLEKILRQPSGLTNHQTQEGGIMTDTVAWTTSKLFNALISAESFNNGVASVEYVEGAEPGLYIIMHMFGDLPIFLSVAGEQIVVESILWPVADVSDQAAFNEEVLRTHKLFPLSTIGIERFSDEDFYVMFGALSAESSLSNIVFEIEMLADNVIKVTEAYAGFLKESSV